MSDAAVVATEYLRTADVDVSLLVEISNIEERNVRADARSALLELESRQR